MKIKRISIFLLVALLSVIVFLIAAYFSLISMGWLPTSSQVRDSNALINQLIVSKEIFLSIEDQASLESVKDRLGIAARHEFTIADGNGSYTLIDCLVSDDRGGDRLDESSCFCFLFRNQKLIKVMLPVSGEMETYPYQGTTATRVKSWEIEDTTRIQRSIAAPALTQNQILNELKPYIGPGSGGSLNNLPAFLITGYFGKIMPRLITEYKTNQVLLQRFDGCKASLGLTVVEIEKLYGMPLRTIPMKNGQTTRLYGDNRQLDLVNNQLRFSWVAVVFDSNEHSAAIYSQDFINDEWKDGGKSP